MGTFFVAMCYLKDFVYRAKGMCVFCQVFSKAWVTSVVVKCLTNVLTQQYVNNDATQEILLWYDTITKQNYFSHNNTIYIQQEGLAMGAPSSGLIAEILLQHTEHTQLTRLTQKHKIINYCRYVDDILIIYDTNHTYPKHPARLQQPTPKPTIHSRNRAKQST
jgi:hypothetical protein